MFQIISADGKICHCITPARFRYVCFKTGDFIITEPVSEWGKVKAEMIHILREDQIQYIIDRDQWPIIFCNYLSEKHYPESDDEKEERNDFSLYDDWLY